MKERTVKKATADKKDTRSADFSARNPYARDNVNVPMGPRVGNSGAHAAKRGNFLDSKAERQPLADSIMAAFSARDREIDENPAEHELPDGGSIDPNSGVKKFKARKNRFAK